MYCEYKALGQSARYGLYSIEVQRTIPSDRSEEPLHFTDKPILLFFTENENRLKAFLLGKAAAYSSSSNRPAARNASSSVNVSAALAYKRLNMPYTSS